MTQQIHSRDALHHSREWDSSTPLPENGHVVHAMITSALLHARLFIGENHLDIYRGDEFAREVTERTSREVVLGHTALLKTAHEVPFFLAQLPPSDRTTDPAKLIYTPLSSRSSVILETSPDAPYLPLRYHKRIQLAEMRTDTFGDLYIENFDIDNELSLRPIKSMGEGALRACRLPERNYLRPLTADTTEGLHLL